MVGRRLVMSSSSIALLSLLVVLQHQCGDGGAALDAGAFARANGTNFLMNGSTFYFNGFNAYWFMFMAFEPAMRDKVTSTLEEASRFQMSLARTWAFSDGGDRPLQVTPGVYNEDMFKALDFVVAEASRNKVNLILSLVNNYKDFGGRNQYVQWAKDRGESVSSDDDFYKNEVIKGYYKNHLETVITRKNTITGVTYRDDPTIFAWELINEPRCEGDLTGQTLQAWITEMATYVKSIDGNHMLEVGLEGFYGESTPEKKRFNPGGVVFGTDFITNNQISGIDFATIHAYPDQWLSGSDDRAQLKFLEDWTEVHMSDSAVILNKPLIYGEFGKSSKDLEYNSTQRDEIFAVAYKGIYESASRGGPYCGGLFWQMMSLGMDNMRDGYEIIMSESSSTTKIISEQSAQISRLNHHI